ncbi:hypothetical protein, partial [Xanthomonas citri]|uniref:hypothetical protein n=1 Tax=Xanthomonas citri TaxID=346 RepID=UPI001F449267
TRKFHFWRLLIGGGITPGQNEGRHHRRHRVCVDRIRFRPGLHAEAKTEQAQGASDDGQHVQQA